ncbi:SWIM zinc finger family protein [Streptomyces minutiscleroticus]|uniref:SWIM zinc finger family protein n=1 Tax=Streptomyces minutiscleroticus TaxID=68238 RepID=UPI003D9F6C3E
MADGLGAAFALPTPAADDAPAVGGEGTPPPSASTTGGEVAPSGAAAGSEGTASSSEPTTRGEAAPSGSATKGGVTPSPSASAVGGEGTPPPSGPTTGGETAPFRSASTAEGEGAPSGSAARGGVTPSPSASAAGGERTPYVPAAEGEGAPSGSAARGGVAPSPSASAAGGERTPYVPAADGEGAPSAPAATGRTASSQSAPTVPTAPVEPDRRSVGGAVASRPRPLPVSMAAPGRDGDLRRTFPACPPRDPSADGVADTWWGNAWVTALEEGALDAARLARGRTYAWQGHVDAITVTPGLVLAYVRGSRARPYRVQIRLRTLSDTDWDRFLDAAAERPGHIAALLDKELPHSLADCGAALLPGPGDLAARCSCPDSGHPCKHAAAVCYQTARLLDQDPFVLLLLRGRGERELIDALSRRNAAWTARSARDADSARAEDDGEGPVLPGVRARDALAPRTPPPLPPPLPAPARPGHPPALPASPGGPDPFALDQLATDAAARAHALLTTGRDPLAGLTLWQDAVRLAAARPGSGLTAATRGLYSALASAAGRTTAELARAVAAWRQGGLEGLAVLEEEWDPPAGRFDRARPLLLAADLPAFRPRHNRLTHPYGHAQLRLGRDGLWYAYESEPGREDWWPRGTPDPDPVGALTDLGLADGGGT